VLTGAYSLAVNNFDAIAVVSTVIEPVDVIGLEGVANIP